MYDVNKISNNLIERLVKEDNKDITKNFADTLSLSTSLHREIQIADIDEDVGEAVETLIRFWNTYDNEQNTPIEKRIPIKIYIDSCGGSLHATFTMIDAIRMSKTPVYTINIGTAFSGGFFTFIAGHKRFAYPHSTFLYHEGSTGGGRQDAGKFRNYANFYEKMLEQLKELTLKYTKITEDEYNKHILDDWWLMANEALELGVCDEIITNFIDGGNINNENN